MKFEILIERSEFSFYENSDNEMLEEFPSRFSSENLSELNVQAYFESDGQEFFNCEELSESEIVNSINVDSTEFDYEETKKHFGELSSLINLSLKCSTADGNLNLINKIFKMNLIAELLTSLVIELSDEKGNYTFRNHSGNLELIV